MNGPRDSTADQAEVPTTAVTSSTGDGTLSDPAPASAPAADIPPAASAAEIASALNGDGDADVFLGLSPGDRVFTLTCVVLGCLLLLVHWARQEGAGLAPVKIERLDPAAYNYRVDANSATWVEFLLLEGIGEQLARRIVADREENGPFASVEDLARVRGIGPRTLARIRSGLQCLPPESSEPEETP